MEWVRAHTPFTEASLEGLSSKHRARLAVRFHIDLKMVPVIEGLAEHLELLVFPCSSVTTDQQGWGYLESAGGVRLEPVWRARLAREFLGGGGFLCDLGGEMVAAAVCEDWPIQAALEGTTSGVRVIEKALQESTAPFPIFDWNAAPLKLQLHNEKMVGFSLWQTFTEVTRLSLHSKRVGVLGFGPVGRGIARTARSLGGQVAVYDPSFEAGLVAEYEGFSCLKRSDLLSRSDVLVTATGRDGVLALGDLACLPSGAFLLNAGHSEKELAGEIRAHSGWKPVLENVEKLERPDGSHIYLLARGRLLNLAAGFGDTINAFDLTSAQLVSAIRFMLENFGSVQPGFVPLRGDFFHS